MTHSTDLTFRAGAATAPAACGQLPPVLNSEALHELTFGNELLQARLFAAFLRGVGDARRRLHACRAPATLLEEVHRLQGTSHFVAADRLGKLLQRVQKRPPGHGEDLPTVVRAIVRELDLLEAAVLARTSARQDVAAGGAQ